jgi:uncharacterized membrane protein
MGAAMTEPVVPSSAFRRFVHARTRLLLAFAAGLVLFVLLPQDMRFATRTLLAWDLTALAYIVMTLTMIARSTVETCYARAAYYDEGDWVILLVVVVSASASFATIFSELAVLKTPHGSLWHALVLTGATVALSWTFTHLVFTLHYANIYYQPDDDGPGGLEFPGDRPPDYWDFVYYSFVIGCAAQTGDVGTVSPAMRRVTLVHGIVSFVFNTAILALTINVGASLLS